MSSRGSSSTELTLEGVNEMGAVKRKGEEKLGFLRTAGVVLASVALLAMIMFLIAGFG